jgi:hypothetical protein
LPRGIVRQGLFALPLSFCLLLPVGIVMRLCRASTLEQIKRKHHDCCHQQKVNQAAGNKAPIEPNQPEQQQNYENRPQHNHLSPQLNLFDNFLFKR